MILYWFWLRGKKKEADIFEQDFNTLNENLKLITYEVLKSSLIKIYFFAKGGEMQSKKNR